MGSGGSGSGTSEDGMTAKLMAQPFGVWLVGLVGVIIAGVAAFQFYKAFSGKFKERLNFSGVAQKTRELLCRTCQTGLLAKLRERSGNALSNIHFTRSLFEVRPCVGIRMGSTQLALKTIALSLEKR